MYHGGPPSHFTVFFSELMISPTVPDRERKRGIPQDIEKNENDTDMSAVVWILPDILIGGVVLVEQDDNSVLSFAVQPVGITTLHTVCDTVRGGIPIVTDEWSAVTQMRTVHSTGLSGRKYQKYRLQTRR